MWNHIFVLHRYWFIIDLCVPIDPTCLCQRDQGHLPQYDDVKKWVYVGVITSTFNNDGYFFIFFFENVYQKFKNVTPPCGLSKSLMHAGAATEYHSNPHTYQAFHTSSFRGVFFLISGLFSSLPRQKELLFVLVYFVSL